MFKTSNGNREAFCCKDQLMEQVTCGLVLQTLKQHKIKWWNSVKVNFSNLISVPKRFDYEAMILFLWLNWGLEARLAMLKNYEKNNVWKMSDKTNVDLPFVAVLWKLLFQSSINLNFLIPWGFSESSFLFISFSLETFSKNKWTRDRPEKMGLSFHAKYLKMM